MSGAVGHWEKLSFVDWEKGEDGRYLGQVQRSTYRKPFKGENLNRDLIAQSPDMLSGKPWDYMRTARFSAFGLCIHGPIGHYWYQFLDRTVMTNAPKSGIAVATKTAIDQLLWAPIFTSIFFSFMKTVEGHPDQVVDEVKTKLWPTMKVNWGVWPLAHLINFRFVPSSQRILYINSVQIGYNTFLSTMAAAKTKEETPAA